MRRALAAVLVLALSVPLIAGVLQLPRPGAPDAPVQAHVTAFYIEGGAAAAGAENLVTAVLLNYRGLDTFGEVVVIFSAWLAVMAVAVPAARARRETEPVSPVVAYIIPLLAPFIAAFGIFVILKGHVLPGGGFQGGVILGAMAILLALVLGPERVAGALPKAAWRALRATGVVVFSAVALAGVLASGHLFGLPQDAPHLREGLMILLEAAIGAGGAAVVAGLFLAMTGSEGP